MSLWCRDATKNINLASWTLYIHMFSCADIFTCARSLSNGVEMNAWLVAMALLQRFFHLPRRDAANYSRSRLSLVLVAFCIVFSIMARPTSALLWLPLGVWLWALPLTPPAPIPDSPSPVALFWSREDRLWVSAIVH